MLDLDGQKIEDLDGIKLLPLLSLLSKQEKLAILFPVLSFSSYLPSKQNNIYR